MSPKSIDEVIPEVIPEVRNGPLKQGFLTLQVTVTSYKLQKPFRCSGCIRLQVVAGGCIWLQVVASGCEQPCADGCEHRFLAVNRGLWVLFTWYLA